jgi:hypothetical protein
MGEADYLKLGDWNAECFKCGRKFKASQLRKQWQGGYVCLAHWEARHPQDFVRGVPDNPAPPWLQPIAQEIFAVFCTFSGTQAIPGLAIPGCAIPSRNNHLVPSTYGFCLLTGNQSRADIAQADCWTVGVV